MSNFSIALKKGPIFLCQYRAAEKLEPKDIILKLSIRTKKGLEKMLEPITGKTARVN
jgi:hypothetical protein